MYFWLLAAGSFLLAVWLWRALQHGLQWHFPRRVMRLPGAPEGLVILEPTVVAASLSGIRVSGLTATIDCCCPATPEARARSDTLPTPLTRDRTHKECAGDGWKAIQSLILALSASAAQVSAPWILQTCAHWLSSESVQNGATTAQGQHSRDGWSFTLPIKLEAIALRVKHPMLPGSTLSCRMSEVQLSLTMRMGTSQGLLFQLELSCSDIAARTPERDPVGPNESPCIELTVVESLSARDGACRASITVPIQALLSTGIASRGQTEAPVDASAQAPIGADVQWQIGSVQCRCQDALDWISTRDRDQSEVPPLSELRTAPMVSSQEQDNHQHATTPQSTSPAQATPAAPRWMDALVRQVEVYAQRYDGQAALSALQGRIMHLWWSSASAWTRGVTLTGRIENIQAIAETSSHKGLEAELTLTGVQCRSTGSVRQLAVTARSISCCTSTDRFYCSVQAGHTQAQCGALAPLNDPAANPAVDWHGRLPLVETCGFVLAQCSTSRLSVCVSRRLDRDQRAATGISSSTCLLSLEMHPLGEDRLSALASVETCHSVRVGETRITAYPPAWRACQSIGQEVARIAALRAAAREDSSSPASSPSEQPVDRARPETVSLLVSGVTVAVHPEARVCQRQRHRSEEPSTAEAYLQAVLVGTGSLHGQMLGLQAHIAPTTSRCSCSALAVFLAGHDTGLLLQKGRVLWDTKQEISLNISCGDMMLGLYRHGNVPEALAGLSTCCAPRRPGDTTGLITILADMESTAWHDTAVARRVAIPRNEKRRYNTSNYSIAAKRVPLSMRLTEFDVKIMAPLQRSLESDRSSTARTPSTSDCRRLCTSQIGSIKGMLAVEGAPVIVYRVQRLAGVIRETQYRLQCMQQQEASKILQASASSREDAGVQDQHQMPEPSLLAQALKDAFADSEYGVQYFARPASDLPPRLPYRQVDGAQGFTAIHTEDAYAGIVRKSSGTLSSILAGSFSSDQPWWYSSLCVTCDVMSFTVADRGQGLPKYAPGRLVDEYGADRRINARSNGRSRVRAAAAAHSLEDVSSSPERRIGQQTNSAEEDASSGDDDSDLQMKQILPADVPGRAAGKIELHLHGLWLSAQQSGGSASSLSVLAGSSSAATEGHAVPMLRIRAGAASVTAVELLDVAPPVHFDGMEGAVLEPVPLLRIMPHVVAASTGVAEAPVAKRREADSDGRSPMLSAGRHPAGQDSSERGLAVPVNPGQGESDPLRRESTTLSASRQGQTHASSSRDTDARNSGLTASVQPSASMSDRFQHPQPHQAVEQRALSMDFTRTGWCIPPSVVAWQEIIPADNKHSSRLSDQRQKDVCVRRDYEERVQRAVLQAVAVPLQEEGNRPSHRPKEDSQPERIGNEKTKDVPASFSTAPGVSWMAFEHVDQHSYTLLPPFVAHGRIQDSTATRTRNTAEDRGNTVYAGGQAMDAVNLSVGVLHAHLRGRAVAWAKALQDSDVARDVLGLSAMPDVVVGSSDIERGSRYEPEAIDALPPRGGTGVGARAALSPHARSSSHEHTPSSCESTRGVSTVSLPVFYGHRTSPSDGRMFTGVEDGEDWEENFPFTTGWGDQAAHTAGTLSVGAERVQQALQPLVVSVMVQMHHPGGPLRLVHPSSACLQLSFDPECGVNSLPLGVANTLAAWVTQQGEKVFAFLRDVAPSAAEPLLQAGLGSQGLVSRLLQPGIAVQLSAMRGLRLSIPSTVALPYPGTWLDGCVQMERAVRRHAENMLNQAAEAAHNTGAVDPLVSSLARQVHQGVQQPLKSAGEALESFMNTETLTAAVSTTIASMGSSSAQLRTVAAVASQGGRVLGHVLSSNLSKAAPTVAMATAQGASAVAAAATGAVGAARPLWSRVSSFLAPPSPSKPLLRPSQSLAVPTGTYPQRIAGQGTAEVGHGVREIGEEDGGFVLLATGPVQSARPSDARMPAHAHSQASSGQTPVASHLHTVQLLPLPHSGASPGSTHNSMSTYFSLPRPPLTQRAQDMDEMMETFNP